MYATKRKIHNLINAATGNPSVKDTTVPSTPPKAVATTPTTNTFAIPATPDQTAAGKKRKIDQIPPSSPAPSTPSYSIRPVSAAGSVVSVSSGIPGRQHPTYQPWDRHEFLDRLSSYRSVDRWGAKPQEVNEVEWAKRGWECNGKERVRCVSCRAEVVVQVEGEAQGDEDGDVTLEDVEGSLNISAEIVRRYQELIITSHDDSCQWKKRGCEDTIYHLPLAKASNSLPPFLTRYHSLLPITTSIPPTLTSPTISPPLTSLDLTSLTRHLTSFPTHATNTITNTAPNANALVLALFGWECEDPKIPLLTCSACFRRLGLWLFKSDEGGDEASVSKLDVRGEHRDYCPWVNSSTQGGEEGWVTLLRVCRREGGKKSSDGGAVATGDGGSVVEGAPGGGTDGKEKTANLESRLKRLKTVYFGKGKKRNSIAGGVLEKKG